MTGRTLSLSLSRPLGADLIARVIGRAVRAEVPVPPVSEVVLPRRGTIELQVEPGSYSIQVILPSGRMFFQAFEVGDDGLRLAIEVPEPARGGESDADSTVPEAATGSQDAGGRSLGFVRRGIDRVARKMFGSSSQGVARPRSIARSGPMRTSAVHLLHLPSGGSEWHLLARPPSDWPKSEASGATRSTLEPASVPGSEVFVVDGPSAGTWAWIQTGARDRFVRLPRLRPDDPADGPVAQVRIALRAADQSMRVDVPSAAHAGLLAYFANARISVLEPMIDAMERDGSLEAAVSGPLADPLSACMAAYVRLAAARDPLPGHWRTWLAALSEANPDVPDCAVVHARYMVLQGGPEERGLARDLLVRAVGAGVPCFTAGLQSLRDMLLEMGGGGDLQPLLSQVEAVAARADFSSFLSTVGHVRS